MTTRYFRGDVVDQLFARIDGSDPAWYLVDHLGSVRDVVDEAGDLAKSVAYDSFGNMVDDSGTAELGRYAWTGREYDVETELQYNRVRYYDPTTGRWIAQDPLGFDAGDSNLYRYVKNRPTVAGDPSGQEERTRIQMPEAGKFDGGSTRFTVFDKVLYRVSYVAGVMTIGQFHPGANKLTIDGKELVAKAKAANNGEMPPIKVAYHHGIDFEIVAQFSDAKEQAKYYWSQSVKHEFAGKNKEKLEKNTDWHFDGGEYVYAGQRYGKNNDLILFDTPLYGSGGNLPQKFWPYDANSGTYTFLPLDKQTFNDIRNAQMKFFGEDEFQVTYHFYQNLIYLKNKKEAVLKGTWGWNFTVRWYKMNNEYKVDVVNIQRPQWKKAN